MRVLVLNAGSSSLKAAVASDAEPGVLTDRVTVERVGSPAGPADHGAAVERALDAISLRRPSGTVLEEPGIVGHRVVQGGTAFTSPTPIDDRVLDDLRGLVPLAPLHQAAAIRVIEAARLRFPRAVHVACFDTAFHVTMPELHTRFAIPRELHEAGVRRYGFHGLSYAWIVRELARTDRSLAVGRVVIAHLGAGASLCGVLGGRSVTTTMGMTPVDGLPMATRCGRLDVGAVLHLQRGLGLSLEAVDELLQRQSGLLGLSGVSGDVRDLLASREPSAAMALDFFAAAVAREVAAAASDLGGLDGIVFTAGIGERSPEVRRAVTDRLSWLGCRLEDAANERNDTVLNAADSTVQLRRISTDEEAMIVRQCLEVVDAATA